MKIILGSLKMVDFTMAKDWIILISTALLQFQMINLTFCQNTFQYNFIGTILGVLDVAASLKSLFLSL